MDLKITDVKTIACEAPTHFKGEPYNATRNLVFVKVLTNEGITGIGECMAGRWMSHYIVEAGVKALKGQIIGENPFDVEKLWRKMYRACYFYISPVALSGIDIALWDILGKKLNKPICELIGGRTRDKIRVYANAFFRGSSYSPDAYSKAAAWAVDQGYTALKFDPFGWPRRQDHLLTKRDARQAVGLIKAVRETVGEDVDIGVECHARFNPYTAIQIGKKLEVFDPLFYEEPIPPEYVDGMVKVKEHIDMPIATGERVYTRYGFREYLEKGAADILQPDIVVTGGISEVKKIAIMAETRYVYIAPHNPNGPVSTMASVHIGASIPNFLILEYLSKPNPPWRKKITKEPIEIKNGFIEVPTKPGLGIELNEKEIAKHPAKDEVTQWGRAPSTTRSMQ